jgi:DNA-binding response OmpR family regulator
MSRLLVVEDEANLAQGLLFNLQAEGHEVRVEGNGDTALETLRRDHYDAIVLDDIVKGFAAGADDYLPKPFELSVLLARLNALLRRMTWPHPPPQPAAQDDHPVEFSFAGRRIDFDSLELHAPDRTIRLTLMESDLLRYLVRNRERIVSRKELLEQVWHVREDTDTRAIDNFIVRLRRYIEDDPASPRHLETIRGVGYRFLPHPDSQPDSPPDPAT